MALKDHLSHENTYQRMTQSDAITAAIKIAELNAAWINKWREEKVITKSELRFLTEKSQCASPLESLSTFYVTMKVQKTPLKTRPIVSYSGSRLHPMGVWVDTKLQIAARSVCTYFKSSFDLKKELTGTTWPANTRIFTSDAVSMYTNIPTQQALETIG